ncbi:hypothetical protein N7478_003841 [Penicillium angulare]|uniref:uncharacterized protein n=1 Tax=Penicillium angulare TaxID=116970 RepID=UPI00254145BA|nr:uncharacterized protein N7478_003841 [Penicillium angulare]KAJ5288155.1 hypothetical protein N7478_003841 [Penicillium angulare]
MRSPASTLVAIGACLLDLTNATGNGQRKTCVVQGGGTNATDDAPQILHAFKTCGQHGTVIFEPKDYYVNSVMNVSWLKDVDIDIHGRLVWSTDIVYWLNNSMDVGYQNQSTAFIIGGDDVRINAFDVGTFDGNGDYWYQWIREQPNTSNYPGRPHAVTFSHLTNSVIRGLRFLRSQMWTMSIIYSQDVLLDSIFVNNTGNIAQSSNTDGADTIRSSHITFNNWTVYNGDDSIALKANSTDIKITNSKFFNGLGIAIGSIGQYKDQFETVERVTVDNINYDNTLHAFYVKTWTADQNGYPPNGGGGGLGYLSDVKVRNLNATGLRGAAFSISQCTRFSGAPGVGNCTNSEFQIKNVEIDRLFGTSESTQVTSLQCSAVAPCTNITVLEANLQLDNGTQAEQYLCGNVVNPIGFECTGAACVGSSATGGC